jgi:hypothetical protein
MGIIIESDKALVTMLRSLVTVDLSLPAEKLQAAVESILHILLRGLQPKFEGLSRSLLKWA